MDNGEDMKNKRSIVWTMALAAILFTGAFNDSARAQPTAAQLKAIEPKTAVSFTWHRPGKLEWSSTYKKYVYSIHWTAKRKTDQPGVYVTIKGYSSFDVIGGKYVYWRDFVSGNSYDGQKPPMLAEMNATMQKVDLREMARPEQVGEYESLRLAPDPDYEWHTMNSVSFTVIAVYSKRFSGGYYDADSPQQPPTPSGKQAVDRIEHHLRFRLYRDGLTVPWRTLDVSDTITKASNRNSLITVKKLLDRRYVDYMAARELPGPTRPPVLTQ